MSKPVVTFYFRKHKAIKNVEYDDFPHDELEGKTMSDKRDELIRDIRSVSGLNDGNAQIVFNFLVSIEMITDTYTTLDNGSLKAEYRPIGILKDFIRHKKIKMVGEGTYPKDEIC